MRIGGPLIALVLLGVLAGRSTRAEEASGGNETAASNSSGEVGSSRRPADHTPAAVPGSANLRRGARADPKDGEPDGKDSGFPAANAGAEGNATGPNPTDVSI